MTSIIIVSTVLLLTTLVVLVRGLFTRSIEVMSFHNLFLLGMIQFFLLPCALIPTYGANGWYNETGEGWPILAFLLPPFMLVYFWAAKIGRKWEWPDKIVPAFNFPITSAGLVMGMGACAILVGLVFVLPGASYSEALLFETRPLLATVVAGLATALVISSPRNILWWTIALLAFGAALIVSTINSNDRRMPMSVFLSVLWVGYWLWLRYKPTAYIVTTMVLGGFLCLFFLLGYTNIRHNLTLKDASWEGRTAQLNEAFTSEKSVFNEDNTKALFWQDAPLNSVYLIENYPSNYPLMPGNGILTFLTLPIPRAIWEGKPDSLGILMQQQLGAKGNLAPGIIGQGWVEALVPGVIAYAIFFGIFTNMWDKLLTLRAHNAYFVVASGSALANIVGLPRGSTFQFFAQWFTGFVTLTLIYWVLYLAAGPLFRVTKPLVFGSKDKDKLLPEHHDQHEHDASHEHHEAVPA